MRLYSYPEKKGWKLLFAAFFLLILLLSRDTLLALNMVGFYKSQILTALLILTTGVFFLIYQRKQLKAIVSDPRIILMALSAVLLLVPMILKRDWQLMYFSILFYVLTGIFISYFISLEAASKYYVVMMAGLGIYSVLCTYVLRILPDRGMIQIPVFLNSREVEFYNFGLAQVSLEYVKNRNFGIFREPGVYQFFLLLGLYLNNYRVSWEKHWQLWTVNILLAVTMLSTFATGGVIEMGLLAAFLFFDKKWYRQRIARCIACGLILLAAGGAAWILLTKNGLYEDFMVMITKFSSEESGSTRFDAIAVDAGIFFHHPILGDKVEQVLHAVESNSTSTMVLYAFLGFLGGSFHVVSWAALSWDKERGILGNLILLVILFMSFNTQNLSWNIIFWLFPMLALAQRGLPLLCRKKG